MKIFLSEAFIKFNMKSTKETETPKVVVLHIAVVHVGVWLVSFPASVQGTESGAATAVGW